MFMTNIPRRKIYETMLEFEDGLIEMQILIFNQKNFDEYSHKFNNETFDKIKDSYTEIKALLVMFLQNKKFELDGNFDDELKKLKGDHMKVVRYINDSKSLNNKFKKLLYHIDKKIMEKKKVESFDDAKDTFAKFDDFNDFIPKILTIRRENMHLK